MATPTDAKGADAGATPAAAEGEASAAVDPFGMAADGKTDIYEVAKEAAGLKVTPENLSQHVNRQELDEYRAIFALLDEDGSGAIDCDEMEGAFVEMGIKVSRTELEALVAETDADGSGEIDFEEFACMLHNISYGMKAKQNKWSGGGKFFRNYIKMPDHWDNPDSPDVTFKEHLWAFMDDPGSRPGSDHFAVFIMLLILFSCVSFVVETIPGLHQKDEAMWDGMEAFCIAIFTAEFVLRVASTPDHCKFLKGALNWVDFVAIAPWYIEAVAKMMAEGAGGGGGLTVLRVVRLVRVFRVVRVGRHMSWLKIFSRAMRDSMLPLGMVQFLMWIAVIFVGAVVYFSEKGENGDYCGRYPGADFVSCDALGNQTCTGGTCTGTEASRKACEWPAPDGCGGTWHREDIYLIRDNMNPFSQNASCGADCMIPSIIKSVPAAFWPCIITMTTIGYGDIVPITLMGKLFMVFCMIGGILLLAVPISVISANFQTEFLRDKIKRDIKASTTKKLIKARLTVKQRARELEEEKRRKAEKEADGKIISSADRAASPNTQAKNMLAAEKDATRSEDEIMMASAFELIRANLDRCFEGTRDGEEKNREVMTEELSDLTNDHLDYLFNRRQSVFAKQIAMLQRAERRRTQASARSMDLTKYSVIASPMRSIRKMSLYIKHNGVIPPEKTEAQMLDDLASAGAIN